MEGYDVVYFVKDKSINEELTYSIRSVVANFPHRKIWIYGGIPSNLIKENYVMELQVGTTKWDKVRRMFMHAANNNDITESFYLFNDDFFVMKKVEKMPVLYRGPLAEHILTIEGVYGNKPTNYTKQLRKVFYKLGDENLPRRSYELHVPFLFNRKKLAEIIRKYPDLRCTRTMYGNCNDIGGERVDDVKVYGGSRNPVKSYSTFLSTDDKAWRTNTMGVTNYIKSSFPEKSRYEK